MSVPRTVITTSVPPGTDPRLVTVARIVTRSPGSAVAGASSAVTRGRGCTYRGSVARSAAVARRNRTAWPPLVSTAATNVSSRVTNDRLTASGVGFVS
jgi:hypothetical protein